MVSRRPINRFHLLVIPKEHYEHFTDLPDTLAAHLFLQAKRLSAALRAVAAPDAISHLSDDDLTGCGFNLVRHYKFHLIPRYKGDRVKINWNREPDPGDRVRATYAALVRQALSCPSSGS